MNLPVPVIQEVHSFEQIRKRLAGKSVKALLVGSATGGTAKAVERAASDSWLEVVGNLESSKLSNLSTQISESRADLVVQGDDLISELVMALKEAGSGRQFLSHVAVIKPQKYPKLLLLTDGAVNIDPDLKTKVALIENLALVARSIGIERPCVAPVAAVEAIYPQMSVTVDGAVLAKMSDRGQIKSAVVDGPLSFDVAVDMFAAHSKGITSSQVAGQTDALLASNVQVGRGLYEAMGLFCQAERGAVIVGGQLPVAVNEPFDDAESRYNSILLAALCSKHIK